MGSSNAITVLIDAFRCSGEPGTSGDTYVRLLAKALRASGFDVVLIAPAWPDGHAIDDCRTVSFGPRNLAPERSFLRQLAWIQLVIPFALFRSRELRRASVVIAPYHHPPVLTRRRVGVITVVHDLCGLGYGYPRYKFGYWRHWIMLCLTAHFSDRTVPVSECTRRSFVERFPSAAGRCCLPVRNALDGEMEATSRDRRRGFIVISADSPRKGTALAIRAYEHYVDVLGGEQPLVIIGRSGKAAWPTDLRGGKIVCLGEVSDAERDALYSSSLGLIFLSLCEGYGYPLAEAAQKGCLALASPKCIAFEVLGDGALSIEDPHDYVEVAMRLSELEHMEGIEYRRLLDRAQTRLLRVSSFAKFAELWTYVVRDLVSGQEVKGKPT